jgi:hypothetical protein
LHPLLGQDVANQVVAKVGTGGKVSLYTNTGATHLTADVVGYFAPDDGDAFTAVVAGAALDTRSAKVPAGWPAGQKLVAGGSFARLDLPVAGVGDVPADARAVSVAITEIAPSSSATRITAFPAGAANPGITNVTAPAGGLRTVNAVVPIGAGGQISFAVSGGSAHLLVSVSGYFGPFARDTFFPLNPARVFDTRATSGSTSIPGWSGLVQPGLGPVVTFPGRAGIPLNARSVAVTTSSTASPAPGILIAAPWGGSIALRSELVYGTNVNTTNTNLFGLGENGWLVYLSFAGTPTHLFSDAYGYFR